MLTNEIVKNKLIEKFGEQVSNFSEPYGMLTFDASNDIHLKLLTFLHDDPELEFTFLNDLTAVHYPDHKEKNWR